MSFIAQLFPERRADPQQMLANELVRQTNDIMAELIRERHRKDLKQWQGAERMGTTREAVAQLERQDANPTLSSIRRYALAVEARIQVRVTDARPWQRVQHALAHDEALTPSHWTGGDSGREADWKKQVAATRPRRTSRSREAVPA